MAHPNPEAGFAVVIDGPAENLTRYITALLNVVESSAAKPEEKAAALELIKHLTPEKGQR